MYTEGFYLLKYKDSRLTDAVYLFGVFEIKFLTHNEKVFSSLPKAKQFAFLPPQSPHSTVRLFAGVQGFEPRLKASKASVLPLDDTPSSNRKSIPNIHEKSRCKIFTY